MSIRRFSSRAHRLNASFLMQHMAGARSYKRIAGYFASSLFEAAGEAIKPRATSPESLFALYNNLDKRCGLRYKLH